MKACALVVSLFLTACDARMNVEAQKMAIEACKSQGRAAFANAFKVECLDTKNAAK